MSQQSRELLIVLMREDLFCNPNDEVLKVASLC